MRIKELRLSYDKTQSEIAELLEITRQAYTHYESGERKPSIETICILADYYGVTLDYIVGRTTIPNIYKVTKLKEYEDDLIKNKAIELLTEMLQKLS
ncbi:XRE family transcriptional regulator [Butyricicoccus sp. 1XD8-22]|nr:XRE family transcriptional regulator [Butyricicoccus sp. 1XD8-22]